MDEMPYLAYAGLHHEDKNLTVEQVEDLLDEAIPKDYTVMGLTQIVVDALATQMGVDPKAEASTQKETATVKMPTKTTASTKPPKKKPSPSGSPTPS